MKLYFNAFVIIFIVLQLINAQLNSKNELDIIDKLNLSKHELTAKDSENDLCFKLFTANDICAHVREHCADFAEGPINYLELYYCNFNSIPTIGIIILAGVTFLAFGNGSPDLFSTFSALKAGKGAMAVGELIGAAWFITSVVVGSMAIVKSFNVIGPLLLRDLWFFTGAVLVLLFIIWDGKITILESLGLCIYYLIYVATVLIGNWYTKQDAADDPTNENTRLLSTIMPSTNTMDSRMPPVTPITYYKRMNFWTAHEIEDALKTLEPYDPPSLKHSRTMDHIGHMLHHHQVLRSKSHSPYRNQLPGTSSPAGSFTSLLPVPEEDETPARPIHVNRFKRDNSPAPLLIPIKPDDDTEETPNLIANISVSAPDNTLLLPDLPNNIMTTTPVSEPESIDWSPPIEPTLSLLLFPGSMDWKSQSLYEKFINIITFPMYFIFTLTVPVQLNTSEDTPGNSSASSVPSMLEVPIFVTPASPSLPPLSDHESGQVSLARVKSDPTIQLKLIQAFMIPIFCFEVVLAQNDLASRSLWWVSVLVGAASVASLAALYHWYPHVHYQVAGALIGFFQSIMWISFVATSVVDILSAIGLILRINEEVIGLTVFAFGNSLGDFISNVAVARMGYPMMAVSACFAGPMLNMMLGIGISGTILSSSAGDHIYLPVSHITLLSGVGVLVTLLAFNIYLPLNRYRIGKKFGFGLIIGYTTIMTALIFTTVFNKGQPS